MQISKVINFQTFRSLYWPLSDSRATKLRDSFVWSCIKCFSQLIDKPLDENKLSKRLNSSLVNFSKASCLSFSKEICILWKRSWTPYFSKNWRGGYAWKIFLRVVRTPTFGISVKKINSIYYKVLFHRIVFLGFYSRRRKVLNNINNVSPKVS